MKHLNSVQNLLVVLIAIAGGLLAIAIFMHWDVHRKNVEITEAVASIEALRQDEHELRVIEDVLKNTRVEVEELKTRFVGREQEVLFIEFVERLAHVQGLQVSIESIEEHAIEKNELIEKMVMNVNIKGSFIDVSKFVRVVEQMPHHVVIGPVKIKKVIVTNETGNEVVSWEGRITMEVLKLK